jgi:hypothetical protein
MEVTKEVETGGETFTIRKLSWKSLARAKQASQVEAASNMKQLGAELLKAMQSSAADQARASIEAKKADPEERRKAHYGQYDMGAILTAGVVRRGDTSIKLGETDDLDKPTADALFGAIVDLSDPLPEVEAEVQGKP